MFLESCAGVSCAEGQLLLDSTWRSDIHTQHIGKMNARVNKKHRNCMYSKICIVQSVLLDYAHIAMSAPSLAHVIPFSPRVRHLEIQTE